MVTYHVRCHPLEIHFRHQGLIKKLHYSKFFPVNFSSPIWALTCSIGEIFSFVFHEMLFVSNSEAWGMRLTLSAYNFFRASPLRKWRFHHIQFHIVISPLGLKVRRSQRGYHGLALPWRPRGKDDKQTSFWWRGEEKVHKIYPQEFQDFTLQ